MASERRVVFSLTGPVDGATIACRSGVLWVTQSGDLRDYVVRPGTTFTVPGEGHVAIQLFGNAGVTIRLPESRSGRLLRLLQRWGLARSADPAPGHIRSSPGPGRRACCAGPGSDRVQGGGR